MDFRDLPDLESAPAHRMRRTAHLEVPTRDHRPHVVNGLRLLLSEQELSLSDLAHLTAIPYPVIRRMAAAGSNPPLELALRIARVLELPVEAIFGLDEGRDEEPPALSPLGRRAALRYLRESQACTDGSPRNVAR